MDLGVGVLMAARALMGGAFLIVGIRNIPNHGIVTEGLKANKFPLPAFLAAVGIAMQIGFGALTASGLYPAVSALGLLAFTVLATLMFHSFWMFKPPERAAQINAFLANTMLAAGLLALLAAGL